MTISIWTLTRHHVLTSRLYQFTRANVKFVPTYKEFLILDFTSAGLTDLTNKYFSLFTSG